MIFMMDEWLNTELMTKLKIKIFFSVKMMQSVYK